jgi:hypothetical protein
MDGVRAGFESWQGLMRRRASQRSQAFGAQLPAGNLDKDSLIFAGDFERPG